MKDLRLRVLDHLKDGEDSVNNIWSVLGGNKNKLIDALKELEDYLVKNEKNNRHMHKINPDKLEFLNSLRSGPDYDEIINVLKLLLESSQKHDVTYKELEIIDNVIMWLLDKQKECSHALSSPLADNVLKKSAQDEYENCSKIIGIIISFLQKIDPKLATRYSFSLSIRLAIKQGSIDEKWNEFKKIFADQFSY